MAIAFHRQLLRDFAQAVARAEIRPIGIGISYLPTVSYLGGSAFHLDALMAAENKGYRVANER